jgi:hypothetical protein
MIYLDYYWDLSQRGIILDSKLEYGDLKWQDGDTFVFRVAENGRARLEKVTSKQENNPHE